MSRWQYVSAAAELHAEARDDDDAPWSQTFAKKSHGARRDGYGVERTSV